MQQRDGRRIMVTGPRQVQVVPFAVPAGAPGPTEVLIRTRVTLLSGGTEGAFFQGLPIPGRAPRPFPYPTGYANVGEVLAAGAQAGVAPGDLVYTMGNLAAQVSRPPGWTRSARICCPPAQTPPM